MNIEQAEQVAGTLSYSFGIEAEIYEDYSGRGMYGNEVPALVLDGGDIVFVGYAFRSLGFDADDMPTRTDNMGLQVVIY